MLMINRAAGAVTARRRLRWAVATCAVVLVPLLSGCATSAGTGAGTDAGTSGGTSAAASCVAPTAAVSSTQVRAGDSVTLTGEFFFSECLDTGQGGKQTGASGIPVAFTPGAEGATAQQLPAVDADDDGRITTEVTIPADTPAGSALIQIGEAAPVTVEVDAG